MSHRVAIWARLRAWAQALKANVIALWLAARDPRTPWYAKLAAALVAAYALSPIDLIPDFIPVVGYLDDLLIVPLGIMLAVALVPDDLLAELKREATRIAERPVSRAAGLCVVLTWMLGAVGLLIWLRPKG